MKKKKAKHLKLLDVIKNNSTGIFEGNFRASTLSNKKIPPRNPDNISRLVEGEVKVYFSKGKHFLGKYLLLIQKIDRRAGLIFCIVLNKDSSIYEHLSDHILIILKPFFDVDDTTGKFIAILPF